MTGFQRFIKAYCELGTIRLLLLAREVFGEERVELAYLNDEQLRRLAGEVAARWRVGEIQTEIRICPLCLSAFCPGEETAKLCDQCFRDVLSSEDGHYDRVAVDQGRSMDSE